MGCSQSVSNILKKPRLTGSVKDLKIPVQKKENYEERGQNQSEKSMSNGSTTAPENEAEMQIERCESVSTSIIQRRLREAGPNSRKPSYYLHHKWAVLFDRQFIISIIDFSACKLLRICLS